jgi:RimJ/RimL family protein N-acetyltransferase
MDERSDGVVTLSPFTAADAPMMRDGDHDPEIRRRFDFPDDFIPSLEHSRNVVASWEHERSIGKRFPFAVRDATSGVLLGGCELRPLSGKIANLSYWTYPAHRGRGVASRAVALACDVAFGELGVERLEILTDPDNTGSRRVALRNAFVEIGMRDGRVLHSR